MALRQWKMPPLVKIYEALGALGDCRVRIEDERVASVISSDESKTYRVEIEDGGRIISSNDNASYWQGYLGYPPVAVLIARGIIAAHNDASRALAGIPWKEVNLRSASDYAHTIAVAEQHASGRGVGAEELRRAATSVLAALEALAPSKGKRSRPPRESSRE